eukprot:TRINITY_DN29207_c0_g2_i2.p1 TRINITY_DN29207_c0_g2~~TRINITY_DN29207_c0_g2_i2.p1  ORF type:complete len:651 (+),score=236.91 TRINITY_DN29207_c0_g2_i2:579-2531(+)
METQECEEALGELVARTVELQGELDALTMSREAAEKAGAQWVADTSEESRKTAKAQERIDKCKADQGEVNSELAKLRGEMGGHEQELAAAQARQKDVEEMHNKLQEYSDSLQGFNSKLQTDVNRLNTAYEQASAELGQVQGEGAAVQSQLDQTLSVTTALKEKFQVLSSSETAASHQKQQLQESVTKLETELEEESTREAQLKEELSSLTNACWSSEEEYEVLKKQMITLEAEAQAQAEVLSQVEHDLEVHRARMKLVDDSSQERGRSLQAMEERLGQSKTVAAMLEEQISEGELCRKQLHNQILEMKGNIRVFCRVRPITAKEAPKGMPIQVLKPMEEESEEAVENTIRLEFEAKGRQQDHSFQMDRVFGADSSQHEVFAEISQLVQSALDGYKVCVFAYGQTGSGKTFTMLGGDSNDSRGMIPRSVEQIFSTADKLRLRGWEFRMEASFLEIYNETIRDLLSNQSSKLEVKHSQDGTTIVTNLKTVELKSVDQVARVIDKADSNRSVSATNANSQSSRSHSVFTLKLNGFNESTAQTSNGVLHLVDLAGSERLAHSGATGDRLKETQSINKSLSSLGDVISALARNESHIPYRNSKLTYLLQNALGGDSKTLMFANVSPAMESAGETLCTMRFASKVNACVNATAQKN